jgi:flagellar hook-associated protein 3 FlgL
MRITENIVSYNYLDNVNQTREKIVELQAQTASGKRVSKPSDDPRATDAILRLRAALSLNEQYSKNAEDGKGMADATSQALDSLTQVFLTLKDDVTKATNGANTVALSTFAEEVDQLLSQTMDIANTKFNGKFLFGGTQTIDAPFTLSADRETVTKNPNGIDGVISYPVSDTLTQQVNIPGEEAFQGTGLFDLMIQIRDTLKSGLAPTAAQNDAVSQGYDHLLLETSKAGAFVSSLDTITSTLEAQKLQLTQFLSNEQDADLAESVMKLKQQETMLDAALNTGAQILPKSLLDFLK